MRISDAISQLMKLHAEHGDLPLHIIRNGRGGTRELERVGLDYVRDQDPEFLPDPILAMQSEESAFKVALLHSPGNFPCCCGGQ